MIGDELVARCVQVNSVAREDALWFVVRVVLLEMIDECLAEVAQDHSGFGRNFATDGSVLFKHRVEVVGSVDLFADGARRAKNNRSALLTDLCDEISKTGFELVLWRAVVTDAVPDIVDANVDEHDCWVLRKHITFQSLLQIRDLVAANACVDKLRAEFRPLLRNGSRDEPAVSTLSASAGLRDGITEKCDRVSVVDGRRPRGEFVDSAHLLSQGDITCVT